MTTATSSTDRIITDTLVVSAVQMEYRPQESLDSRIERAQALIARAVESRPQSVASATALVVMPELWAHGGFHYSTWLRAAQALDGSVFSAMRKTAQHHRIWLHAGSIIERERGVESPRYWNTSALVSPEGRIHAIYRKMHRFGFGVGEPTLLTAGEHPVVTKLSTNSESGLPVGLSTCYDLRFPELYRATMSEGVELDLVPAAWPLARVEHWSALGRARAIENQRFVVQANLAGQDGAIALGGHSAIIDPNGTVLATTGVEEDIVTATLDFNVLRDLRLNFPVSADRRL